MALADGKKRYQFSLTEETVEKLKELLSFADMPSNTLSVFLDEIFETEIEQLQIFYKKRKAAGQNKFCPADLEDFYTIQ